jgi:hypothetical protein
MRSNTARPHRPGGSIPSRTFGGEMRSWAAFCKCEKAARADGRHSRATILAAIVII